MLVHNENFDIGQIAASGQCFRMNRIEGVEDIRYGLVAYGRYLEIVQIGDDTVELCCSEEEFHQVWEEYFDLKYDYGRIIMDLTDGEDSFLGEAAVYGKGIRILKQEPFEMLISFIISQNKNIPAIKNCIEGICRRYGQRKISANCRNTVYYTFPEAQTLAKASKEELRSLKTGYRDDYILAAAGMAVSGELMLKDLKKASFEEAVAALKKVHGIGEKVANCIALYGLHHIEGFPVDVWILRALKEVYDNHFPKEKYQGYAGIVQQYMFYYIRHLYKIEI